MPPQKKRRGKTGAQATAPPNAHSQEAMAPQRHSKECSSKDVAHAKDVTSQRMYCMRIPRTQWIYLRMDLLHQRCPAKNVPLTMYRKGLYCEERIAKIVPPRCITTRMCCPKDVLQRLCHQGCIATDCPKKNLLQRTCQKSHKDEMPHRFTAQDVPPTMYHKGLHREESGTKNVPPGCIATRMYTASTMYRKGCAANTVPQRTVRRRVYCKECATWMLRYVAPQRCTTPEMYCEECAAHNVPQTTVPQRCTAEN